MEEIPSQALRDKSSDSFPKTSQESEEKFTDINEEMRDLKDEDISRAVASESRSSDYIAAPEKEDDHPLEIITYLP